MNTAKEEIKSLLDKLPDECTLEDVQYHLYVTEKIKSSLARAANGETLTQTEAERKFKRWIAE